MADYYPLIARAIAGLDPSASGEARRALYERARTALIGQLRGVQPALTEAEITRERLALEDAVRRVEADAAKRARPDALRAAASPVRRDAPRPGDSLRDSVRSPRPPLGPLPSRERDTAPLAPEPRPTRNLRADPPPRSEPLRAETPRSPAPPPRDLRAPEPRRNDTQRPMDSRRHHSRGMVQSKGPHTMGPGQSRARTSGRAGARPAYADSQFPGARKSRHQ